MLTPTRVGWGLRRRPPRLDTALTDREVCGVDKQVSKEQQIRQVLGPEYWPTRIVRHAKWVGPLRIADMLDRCLDDEFPKPPESHSMYLVSREPWETYPFSDNCTPLYVGSTTGRSQRFRTRVGDVISDMFGFYQTHSAHSSGGISLHCYCIDEGVRPGELYMSWLSGCGCTRCAEHYFWEDLKPSLNVNQPPLCSLHAGEAVYRAILDLNEDDSK